MRCASRVAILAVFIALAAAGEAPLPQRAEVEALIAEAQGWAVAQQQPSGSLVPGNAFTLGITAMALTALAAEPQALPADHPAMRKAMAFVLGFKQPDGGFYIPEEGLSNYCTALALRAFSAVGGIDPALIAGAQKYLMGGQNGDPESRGFGGMGYGDKGPGHEDLSNTSYALEALRASGVPTSDPHMQAAMKFLERCQNLSSVNKSPWVGQDNKDIGGAVYGPAEAAGSWEEKDNGQPAKFNSTGTMTYSLLSSYIALELTPEDQRVAAALAWIKANYQFAANPGMATGKEQQGLFYYYVLMARTFATMKLTGIDLGNGRTVDWRADLFAAIRDHAKHVKLADGKPGAFWINSAARWAEGMPQVTTAYMIRALKAIASTLP